MNEAARAYGVGAISGSRSMLGPAVAGARLLPPAAERMLGLFAVGEMIADKHAAMPARTTALPLTGRLFMGAAAAASDAPEGRRFRAAMLGAAGALTATYALYHLRRLATTKFGLSNTAAGLIEDALAFGAGALLARKA